MKVYDYSDADFSAHSRIRMMANAFVDLTRLQTELENGEITQIDYSRGASMDILAYSEQLSHLPDDFWDTLPDDLYSIADMLRFVRNDMAHSYYVDPVDYSFIQNTAMVDIPHIHSYVMKFYRNKNLDKKRNEYATNRHYIHPQRIKSDNKQESKKLKKYRKIVNWNKKSA